MAVLRASLQTTRTNGWMLGLQTGPALMILYLVLVVASVSYTWQTPPFGSFGIIIAGFLVMGVPVAILGALTGWLIDCSLSFGGTRVSSAMAVSIGLGVAVMPMLVVNSLFLSALNPGEMARTYLNDGLVRLTIGFPSLIYLAASGWMAWRLNNAARQAHQAAQEQFLKAEPSILRYIRTGRETETRYEIDLHLLRVGWQPDQIERGWQQLEVQSAQSQSQSPLEIRLGNRTYRLGLWKTLLPLLVLTGVLPGVGFWVICTVGLGGAVFLWRRRPALALALLAVVLMLILMTVSNIQVRSLFSWDNF